MHISTIMKYFVTSHPLYTPRTLHISSYDDPTGICADVLDISTPLKWNSDGTFSQYDEKESLQPTITWVMHTSACD